MSTNPIHQLKEMDEKHAASTQSFVEVLTVLTGGNSQLISETLSVVNHAVESAADSSRLGWVVDSTTERLSQCCVTYALSLSPDATDTLLDGSIHTFKELLRSAISIYASNYRDYIETRTVAVATLAKLAKLLKDKRENGED